MEAIDPKTAQQVWKRVASAPVPGLSPGDLHGLIIPAMETAALYARLATLLSGKLREAALVLSREQEQTVCALRGMQRLSFGRSGTVNAPPASQKNAARLLESGYRSARAALTEYTARTIDPEYGCVFRLLAAREEEHCLRILSLLGQV